MLMLDSPKPIRQDVDHKWRAAVCQVLMDVDRSDEAAYASYFFNGDSPQQFPHRRGYYLGYRMIQRIARHYTLPQIDHLNNAAAHRLMMRELHVMATEAGGCATHM